jgi:hypothetical protein
MAHTFKFFFASIFFFCVPFTCWAGTNQQQDTLMLEFAYKKGGYAYLFLQDNVKIVCYDKTKIVGKLSAITDTLLIVINKHNAYFVKPQNIKKIEQIDIRSRHAYRQEGHGLVLLGAAMTVLGVIGMGQAWLSPQIPAEKKASNFAGYLVASVIGVLVFWGMSVFLIKRTKSFNLAKHWRMTTAKQPTRFLQTKSINLMATNNFYKLLQPFCLSRIPCIIFL